MNLIGLGLAAGSGERARPLTLKTDNYLRSKAAIRFMGRPVIELQLAALKANHIADYVIVAKGRENRFQIKTLIGYGETLGIDVRYSPPMHDHLDRGSADATMRTAEHFGLADDLFVFPVDSLFDIDVSALWEQHQDLRAALTMITIPMAGMDTAGTYGVVWADPMGRALEFLEKPSASVLQSRWGATWASAAVPTNAGFYLINSGLLRRLAHEPALARQRLTQLDFGHDLLPWLVNEGYPVYTYPARWVGDLGNLTQYLRTMRDVLTGTANPAGFNWGRDGRPPHRVFAGANPHLINDTWHHVRLGRYCVVGQNCRLENASVGDECVLGHGVTLINCHLDDGVMVGDGATITSSVVGLMADIQSSQAHPTMVSNLSGIGDEAIVQEGAHLTGVLVYPRTKIPAGAIVTGPGTLTSGDSTRGKLAERGVRSLAPIGVHQVSPSGF